MKKYAYLFALSLLLASCGEKEIDLSKLQDRNSVYYGVALFFWGKRIKQVSKLVISRGNVNFE